MRLRLQNSVEASVHIINQASVPQGLSSNLTEASEKQKRISKLQLVTDEAEIKTKDYTMNQVKILISTKKKYEAPFRNNSVETAVHIINQASVP